MKKILSFVLAAVALVFTACSNDETIETSGNGQNNKGMVLVATVSQQSSRAAIDVNDTFGKWNFTFTGTDNVVVGNNTIDNYYTFTKSGETFSSADAKVTSSDAYWYAYYPATDINLTNQEGTPASAAKLYALAGKTEKATTGADGLAIDMKAKAAVLRIVKVDNYGPCDIYLKTADGNYVKGLKAKKNETGYDVVKSDTKVSVFTKANEGNAGIYYVIVPAGVKISVWNNDRCFKTTKDAGLTAGQYYTLTSGPTTGSATAKLADGTTDKVDWVQLWIGGPRIAVKNVEGQMNWTEAAKTGSDYVWGSNWRTASSEEVKIMGKMGDHGMMLNETILKGNYGYQDNKHGFTLTGQQPGYTSNTLFLSGDNTSTNNSVNGKFWLRDELNKGYGTSIDFYGDGINYIFIHVMDQDSPSKDYEVRPILTKETVLWGEQNIQ